MSERVVKGEPVGRVGCERIEHPGVPAGELVLPMPGSGKPNPYQLLPLLHSYTLNPPWKVDRVLANQSLLLTAGACSTRDGLVRYDHWLYPYVSWLISPSRMTTKEQIFQEAFNLPWIIPLGG